MRQQLGLEYSKFNPLSLLVSNRLVDLQKHYGSMKLIGSMMRLKAGRLNANRHQIDRHVSNLELTYGTDLVVKMQGLIFGFTINVKREIA